MFIAVLFIIAKILKQSKCPSKDEWIKKMWFINTIEYNSAIKKEWKFAICYKMDGPGGYYTKWNKSDRDKCCMLSVKCGIKKKTNEYNKNGHHQMVNTKIRLIIFFAAKDGEALYSQQKQDQELTVAQIMNSLLPNSDLNWKK